jgi:hypothetical protein
MDELVIERGAGGLPPDACVFTVPGLAGQIDFVLSSGAVWIGIYTVNATTFRLNKELR